MAELTQPTASPDPKTNRLLAKCEPGDYDALMRHAKIVSLKFRNRLLHQDERVDAVYFPLTCMISLLVTSEDKPRMEMATIGSEGVIGASEVLYTQGAIGLNLVQIPGEALRIDANIFRKLVSTMPLVQQLIQRDQYVLTRQILFGAACNRFHSMNQRCARWLLMTHDRAGKDTFPLTQEFLAHMLGVRRATVNEATSMLKKAGLIRYVRGKITVLDRPGLEAVTCYCYQSIIKVYESQAPRTPKRPRSFSDAPKK